MLVDHVCSLPECHEESLAFMYMMVQLDGCVSCATDSYRAMNGCSLCAYRVLKRFKGSDDDLLARYADAFARGSRIPRPPGRPAAALIVGTSIPAYAIAGG
ncbi:MAG: hypothetical protein HND48_19415 [Chloroflexi bacterium]|nr:hypothetical protein [Chloroflexota bacterium]